MHPVLEDAVSLSRSLDRPVAEPVAQDREVVRSEVQHDAVALVLAEVHRDEVTK